MSSTCLRLAPLEHLATEPKRDLGHDGQVAALYELLIWVPMCIAIAEKLINGLVVSCGIVAAHGEVILSIDPVEFNEIVFVEGQLSSTLE